MQSGSGEKFRHLPESLRKPVKDYALSAIVLVKEAKTIGAVCVARATGDKSNHGQKNIHHTLTSIFVRRNIK
jgi:hypothetical protein